ncbi:unnamed protein product, partial [Musa textilis]
SSRRLATDVNDEGNTSALLHSLPEAELQTLLCSLFAREGLSSNVYVLVDEILKKIVACAPTYH